MSIVSIEFNGYGNEDKIKAISEADYAMLRDIVPTLPEDQAKGGFHLYGTHVIDLETDGPFLCGIGLEFSIKRFKRNYWVGGVAPQVPKPGEPATQVVQHVHIPNPALLAVREVTWLEDACTQELQGMLNQGWHILAVCPPASQRRPDYVLGRTSTD